MQVFCFVCVGAEYESLCGSPISLITLVFTEGNTYLYYTPSPLLFGEIPMQFTSSTDSFIFPANGLLGGLWLVWTDEVQVTIKYSNCYVILVVDVHIATNLEFLLVCVYGD